MAVSDVEGLHEKAGEGVDVWLKELVARLSGVDEVEVCEATRMFVFYARQLRMTSAILSRRCGRDSEEKACLLKLDEGKGLLGEAVDFAKDSDRKNRIRERLALLAEIRNL